MDPEQERRKQEIRQRGVDWLAQKWVSSKECPICKENSWNLGDVSEIREYTPGGGLVIGGKLIPVFPLTCTNCGHVFLFNALIAGLLPVPEQEVPAVGADNEAAEA